MYNENISICMYCVHVQYMHIQLGVSIWHSGGYGAKNIATKRGKKERGFLHFYHLSSFPILFLHT